jgi:DNA-nicking Smr family endonuclease
MMSIAAGSYRGSRRMPQVNPARSGQRAKNGQCFRRVTDGEESEPHIELPIDGVLDLHTFRPKEIGDLIPDYLEECCERGILQVRVVHGKGIGNLKRGVHAILSRLPNVISFSEAGAHFGGSGATIVNLRPKEQK